MSRPKKDPRPPRSTAWEEYRPQDGLYWKFGGPTIPVEEIPPEEYSYKGAGDYLKPSSRASYLADLIERYEQDLAKTIALYLDLAERGIDAMKLDYHKQQDREMDARPDSWVMVERNVDRHRASTYRTIRMRKNQLAQFRAMLAEIDAASFPLMRKKP